MHLGLADLDKSAELIAEHASLLEKALLVVQAVLDRLALLGHACLKGFERSRRGAGRRFRPWSQSGSYRAQRAHRHGRVTWHVESGACADERGNDEGEHGGAAHRCRKKRSASSRPFGDGTRMMRWNGLRR